MDILKEMLISWSQRVRSPILGSVLISFFAFNWKPIWYLLFADRPVRQKFLFFDANTDTQSLFVYPLVVGFGFAIAFPWVQFVGAFIARSPVARLKRLQHDSSHSHKIYELKSNLELLQRQDELDKAREEAQIEAAKRLEAAEEIGGEDLAKDLKQGRELESTENASDEERANNFLMDLGLLFLLSSHPSGRFLLNDDQRGSYTLVIAGLENRFRDREAYLTAVKSVENLMKKGYLERDAKAISRKGYEFIEEQRGELGGDFLIEARNVALDLFRNWATPRG